MGHCWPLRHDTPAFRRASRLGPKLRPPCWLGWPHRSFRTGRVDRSIPCVDRDGPGLRRCASASLPATTQMGTAGVAVHHRPGRSLVAWWFSARQALPGASPGVLSPSAFCKPRRAVRTCRFPDDPASALTLPTARPLFFGRCRWACPCGFSLTLATDFSDPQAPVRLRSCTVDVLLRSVFRYPAGRFRGLAGI